MHMMEFRVICSMCHQAFESPDRMGCLKRKAQFKVSFWFKPDFLVSAECHYWVVTRVLFWERHEVLKNITVQTTKSTSREIRNPKDASDLGERSKSALSESRGPKYFQWLIYTLPYPIMCSQDQPGTLPRHKVPTYKIPWILQTRIEPLISSHACRKPLTFRAQIPNP